MATLFGTPDIPQTDPSVTAARQAEQERASADRLRATQEQLASETLRRRRALSFLTDQFGTGGLTSLIGKG